MLSEEVYIIRERKTKSRREIERGERDKTISKMTSQRQNSEEKWWWGHNIFNSSIETSEPKAMKPTTKNANNREEHTNDS